MPSLKKILEEQVAKSKPTGEELSVLNNIVKDFSTRLQESLKKQGAKASVFVGGSYAKGTLLKKEDYEVDIFVRYDQEFSDKNDISDVTNTALKSFVKNFKLIHGSRDYYAIKLQGNTTIEVVPVLKHKKGKDVANVTDLSYYHVSYVNKELKKKKLREDILLAKAFCKANHCYGAESYIQGFSGYALELLVLHFGGFQKFLKELSKAKDQIVVFNKKDFKNKQQVLIEMNAAKLQSPIVFVDPTFKERNALAALSVETFKKFQIQASSFLKSPSERYFEEQKKDLDKIKKDAEKKKQDFILLEAETNKQEGDIAGSKLLKFYRSLHREIQEYFEVKDKGFQYNKKQAARYFFVAKAKKMKVHKGPLIKDDRSAKAFKAKHKGYKIKNGRLYASEKIDFNLEQFLDNWKRDYRKQIKEMSITRLRVV